MKPFNLEDAKLGKPVQTRDGRKARFISDTLKSPRPVVFAITDASTGEEYLYQYAQDGTGGPAFKELPSDLVMAPVERTVYINVWKAKNGEDACSWPFGSEKGAKDSAKYSDKTFVAVAVPIKITE